jgi:hypothetical protein
MSMFRRGAAKLFLLTTALVALTASTPCVAGVPASKVRPALTIDPSVTIIESPDEPAAVRRATEDLVNDFSKVFGQQPTLTDRLEDSGQVAILISGPKPPDFGARCKAPTGTEAFSFSIVHLGGRQVRDMICLTGADARGTIYAIYHFSQMVLGTDPMYLWTDKQPERRASITLPSDFAKVYAPPVIKYRGLFINDEDLLSGWVPGSKSDRTGISLRVWDNIFETILRLKGNMIVPGTWIFPNDAQLEAAAKRGLILNQHHAIPLGVNVARWPKDVPYNFSTHPEILERAWTNAVATYKPGEELLWSVGLRGLSDASYASLDPSVRDNDELLAKRISGAIADQMKIVRARYPKAQFVTDLWQEGARLMQKGLLKIPPEVTLVWADTGYGDMQDNGRVAAGQGAYFHVAMMNFNANQLSEMVPVSVIDEELGRYINAGATSYLLVNTSDIRPVAMTTRAVMDAAWNGAPTGPDADIAFYKQWASSEFGPKSADAVATVYREYFAAPSMRSNQPAPGLTSAGSAPPPRPEYSRVPRANGDQHYHTEIRRLLLDRLSGGQVAAIPSQSPKWTAPHLAPQPSTEDTKTLLARDLKECEEAQPRWDAVWQDALAARLLVSAERRDYYQAAVLTMITINRESNRALMLIAQALHDDETGDIQKAQFEAHEAGISLEAIEASMHAAEYGKWKNWYRGDWLTGVYRTRELVQAYEDHLKDPMAKLPAPVSWTGWEAYFHIMEYEGDRSVDVH